MVYINWDRIQAITPENFGEDEKDELLQTLTWYSPTSDVSIQQLIALTKALQEILKYKCEQLESLMSALDELASKQGEEVARGRQELIDEIEDLREQLEYQKRLERDSGMSDDEIRNEVVKLEMQNEELVLELQEREKDSVAEKNESERMIGLIARLEREKLELSRELAAFQEESNERQRHSLDFDSHDGSNEKLEELVETVRQKNKHIMHLLDDIEAAEQENKMHQVKLATARSELAEANSKVISLTQELTAVKLKFDEASNTVNDVKNKNKALTSQVEELIQKKLKNDQVLDDFAIKVNERVEEWKKLIDAKDSEIVALKNSLDKNKENKWHETNNGSKEAIKWMKQEQEIEKLKEDILKLSNENSSLKLALDELNKNVTSTPTNEAAKQSISELESYIKALSARLKTAEEDATQKAEEISQLIRQLRAYENNEFGLSEAVEKIKKLEKKIHDRDQRIENLISACNKLGIEKETLEDENDYLREMLELSPQRCVDPTFLKNKSETNAKTIRTLKEEIEFKNNEIMELKLEIRSLKEKTRESNSLIKKSDPNSEINNVDNDEKYLYLVEENDALRKGMHEILESLQKETMGEVETSSLERLLEALDSRHVSGWYHPAMRLQAQLQTVQGECQELRKQVAALRKETISLNCQIEATKFTSREEVNKTESPENLQAENFMESDFGKEKRIIELETSLEQWQLMFDKAKGEWCHERRQLAKERDELLSERKTPAIDSNYSVDQQSVGLMSILKFAHLREESLENEINDLRKSFIEKEDELFSKMATLRIEKLNFKKMIHHQQMQLNSCVPYEEMAQLESELTNLKVSYSQVLNLKVMSSEKRDKKIGSPLVESAEVLPLLEEMKGLKEKIIISESQLNCYGNNIVTPDTFNNELSNLASKLAGVEVELTAEKTKKNILDKFCQTIQETCEKHEADILQLNQEIREVTENNVHLQKTILEIENEIKSLTIFEDPVENLEKLQQKYEILLTEKMKVDDLLEICRKHLKSIEYSNATREIELQYSNECLASIRDMGNEKILITKLTHDLIVEKKANEEMKRINANLEMSFSSSLSEILQKDSRIARLAEELSSTKGKHMQHLKILFTLLTGIRSTSQSALSFPSISQARKIITELEESGQVLSNLVSSTECHEKDLATKEAEMQIELDALYILKSAFKSDSKELVNWHNKTTELRLRETRYKRKAQFLTEEISKMDALLKRYKDEIGTLEEKSLEREKMFDHKMQEWIMSQKALLEIVNDKKSTPIASSSGVDVKAEHLEQKILHLEEINSKLKKEIAQKDAVFKEKLAEQVKSCKAMHDITGKSVQNKEFESVGNESEKKALLQTTSNLQAIINKKEITVIRYQELLKKSREEQSSAITRLQNELRNVHNVLANQSKAYSRLKHGGFQPSSHDIEKYLKKIQELEEELSEVQGNLSRVQTELQSCEQEVDRLRKIAEEREYNADEIRERMEMEVDRYREEIQNYQMEIQQLKELTDGGQTRLLIDTISDLQKKLTRYGLKQPPSPGKGEEKDENTIRNDPLSRLLKASQDECARLRQQLNATRAIKSRPTTAQTKTKEIKENLEEKIQKLEESLKLSKQHEKELDELEAKRLRSVEEVARWDERKRYEKAVEKLQRKLKQKEVETSAALGRLETMRSLYARMEKDKGMLEGHVRNLTESARENRNIEKLIFEKTELTTQVAELEEEITNLKLKEGGKEKADLLAQLKRQGEIIKELQLNERDRRAKPLEREVHRLENENLSLKISLDKLREQNKQLKDSYCRLETELKSIKAQRPSSAKVRTSYDLQLELSKLKIDLKSAQDRLSIITHRNTELEGEIQHLQSQLHLWEEKDLAETLARNNQHRLVAELNQELVDVKSQLAYKVHLLDRVKILLSKAAAKEKALNDKVSALQLMVPESNNLKTQNRSLLD